MLKLIICAVLFISANGHPIRDEEETAGKRSIELVDDVKNKENDLHHVAYVENFKDLMLNYVKTQYNNLTIDEMEEIRDVLEDFLHNFAKDLKDVVERNKSSGEIDDINDGIPEATFDDVKKNIKYELPDINDESANLIVYKLRKNLMITRKKLEEIIKKSERSEIVNS